MGLGNVMRATMYIFAEIYNDRDFEIKLLKHHDSHILFKEEFEKYKNLHFSFVETGEELVKDSDVVMSAATYLDENVCEDKYFKKGVTVIPIHTRGFGNCDLFFDKVYADDTNHVRGFKYFDKFRSFAEVSDVVNGRAKGRENAAERILVYNIGIAIHDMHFASKIYNKVTSPSFELDMHAPKEKYWF
jgi:ornithine cyclodeaminase/alanine dehydrogenase